MHRTINSRVAQANRGESGPVQAVRLALRALVSVALALVFVTLLSQRLSHIDWAEVRAGFTGVSSVHWAAATAATAISFWAVGHYDAVLHRHFATGLPDTLTRRAGICAIAVSQTIGLGVISGALVRWRMLPGQSLWQATRLTAAVALSFLAGWAVVTAGVLAVLPAAPFKTAAAAVLMVALCLAAGCVAARHQRVRLPNGFTLCRLIGLCAVDTGMAALAFYLLCPGDLSLSFAQLLPAFLLALGAGLVSGTPGGVGAFEITLLAFLPDQPAAALLAAVLAWRVIYYALPALIGAALAMRGPLPQAQDHANVVATPGVMACAEAGLYHQGEHRFIAQPAGQQLCARSPHFVVALFDAPNPDRRGLENLIKTARAESRLPALYNVSARSAAIARLAGFKLLRTAQEAWVNPATFSVDAPARAGLRRKLRRAQAAGTSVTIPHGHGPIPWPLLDQIAQNWAMAHGGERGFTMGRYARVYVTQQRLYIAWAQGNPIAFVTFHHAAGGWALDLMRHQAGAPCGVMHLLIQTAIDDARALGVQRLSLAAVPGFGPPGGWGGKPGLLRWIIARLTRNSAGLVQFKSSFAPNWRPLYLAVPSHAAMPLLGAEILRAVFWPRPLAAAATLIPAAAIEHHHEDYEFASARSPWHRQRTS